jgi:hypothetical protein
MSTAANLAPTPGPVSAPALAPTSAASATSTRRHFVLVWLAVSVVITLAHFTYAPQMGIYEDDHWLIGTPMCEWDWSGLWQAEKETFVGYRHGRPLHCGIGFLLSYVGTHAGGLLGAFVLAALVWSVNAGLCLALLWRRFGSIAATVSTLVFVLIPADTTHSLLHTAFYVHTSMTFLLLSGNAYARGRWGLSLVFAALTLLTYETCFLPALVWPLLFPSETRSVWRRTLLHGLAMGLVLVLAVSVRTAVGEERAAGAMSDKRAAFKKVKELATRGPKTAMRTFGTHPVWMVNILLRAKELGWPESAPREIGGVAAGAGLVALLGLIAAYRADRLKKLTGAASADRLPLWRLILAGALMIVLGYVAALNREPRVIVGRMSSIHIASSLGWGLLFGGLGAGLVRLLTYIRAGWLFLPVFAVYVFLLASFHVCVQREYAKAWVAQAEFWRNVAAECPDVRSGTVVLYPLVRPVTPMVHHQEWADYLVFGHLFVVPSDWSLPMFLPLGHLTWSVPPDYKGYNWNEVEREGDQLYLKHWGGPRPKLEPGNIILLRQTPDGRLERVTGTIQIAGIDLPLKPREGPEFNFKPNKLYPLMFPHGMHPEPGPHAVR